jgi:hypothetical protein
MHRLNLEILKSRLPSWSQHDEQEKFYLAKSSAFVGLQAVLNVFKELAATIGVPGLPEGIKALVIVLDVIQVCLL